MHRRTFLIGCTALSATALLNACASTTATQTAASSSTAAPIPVATGVATAALTPTQAAPTLPPTAPVPRPATPASTSTRALTAPPTPPTIDPAFTQKLAAIDPEQLIWLLRDSPFGQTEAPPNLTSPGVGSADIFTTSGPLLALLFVAFREADRRIDYNIYHTADIARERFAAVLDLYQHTADTITRVPPGFPSPSLVSSGKNGTECLIVVGPIMIDGRAGPAPATSPALQDDAFALASAGLAHLQRVILGQATSTPHRT